MQENIKITQSAGGVVLNSLGKVLLVSQNGRSWSLPKGHIEEGETTLDAAKREIYEESGVSELQFVKDLGVYQRYKIALDGGDDYSEQKTIFIFLFKTTQEKLNPIDTENPEARWFDKNEVADVLTHYKDKEFFLSILESIVF